MALVLSGVELARQLQEQLSQRVKEQNFSEQYVAILYLGDNASSATYVRMKQRFAHAIGLPLHIVGQNGEIANDQDLQQQVEKIISDPLCLGFMPQLPLPPQFEHMKMWLFDAIPARIDIDGLGSEFMGKFLTEQLDFLGATPQAVMSLLDYYDLGDLQGKTVTIVGQSNLLGKPLVLACMKRGASVLTFNSKSNDNLVRSSCLKSDIVISCTGVVHRLDESYFCEDQSQVAIDVGWGSYHNKPAGDIVLDAVIPKVKAYTPLPGGIGPLTIANLLMNVKRLYTKNH